MGGIGPSKQIQNSSISSPSRRALIGETRASRILLRVPAIDRHWHVPLRAELGLTYFSDPTHEVEYTRAELERELREAWLEPVEVVARWGELWAEARPDRPDAR